MDVVFVAAVVVVVFVIFFILARIYQGCNNNNKLAICD